MALQRLFERNIKSKFNENSNLKGCRSGKILKIRGIWWENGKDGLWYSVTREVENLLAPIGLHATLFFTSLRQKSKLGFDVGFEPIYPIFKLSIFNHFSQIIILKIGQL